MDKKVAFAFVTILVFSGIAYYLYNNQKISVKISGEREIIFGTASKPEICPVKMEIITIEGFSGHSGRGELMNFMIKCDPKPKKVIVNHGENSRCLDLASSIHKQNRVETNAPRNLEAIRIK